MNRKLNKFTEKVLNKFDFIRCNMKYLVDKEVNERYSSFFLIIENGQWEAKKEKNLHQNFFSFFLRLNGEHKCTYIKKQSLQKKKSYFQYSYLKNSNEWFIVFLYWKNPFPNYDVSQKKCMIIEINDLN